MADDPDLSLVSTDDLLEELFRRHDRVLVVREVEKVKGSFDAVFDFHGGISAAIGLAERFKHEALTRGTEWFKDDDE